MTNQRYGRRFWQVTGLIVAVLLVVGLAGFTFLTGLIGGLPPKVSVLETAYDFGKVTEDRALTHTFAFKNSGGKSLKVEEVDPDCACTAADFDRTIPPGGEGKITLTIKPYSVLGQFKKETRVRLNDPESPLVVFTMKGEVQLFVEIQPSHIIRFRGAPGQDLQTQVRLTSHLAGPWKITKLNTNIPDKIDVSMKEDVPDKVYVVTVKNKSRDAGTYAGVVDLYNNSPHRPRLLLRVFAKLSPPSGAGVPKQP